MLSSCDQKEDLIDSTTEQIDMCTFDFINASSNLTTKPDAAIIDWPRWQTGQTIKIKFLDGDTAAQEKVKRFASIWTNYANLKFEYVSKDEYADIRIGFNVGKPGAWSELGMLSVYGVSDHQSMRLGPLTGEESSVSRKVLHEFGHALGLYHETINPASTIKWNLPKVYAYYEDLMGWSKEEVDAYVIEKSNSSNYSQYDPLSIMHYYVPASLTTNGVGVNEMSVLSTIDMKSINMWYPFPIRSIIASGERIDLIPWTLAIRSPNGNYRLLFDNGLLYIYDEINNTIKWEAGQFAYRYKSNCTLESNGNFVLKGSRSSAAGSIVNTIWSSNTAQYPGAKLQLQDDGNLVLLYNEVVKWSSGD
jgi:hypothetical protein